MMSGVGIILGTAALTFVSVSEAHRIGVFE